MAFRADVEWCYVFAEEWNGVSMVRDLACQSPSVEIWSDASGCGAFREPSGFKYSEVNGQVCRCANRCQGVIADYYGGGCLGPILEGRLCDCDNEAVVSVVKTGYYSCYDLARYDASHTLRSSHSQHRVAHSILRNSLPLFFKLLPLAQPNPCMMPEGLVSHLIREGPTTRARNLITTP